jgi:hypothetical protein
MFTLFEDLPNELIIEIFDYTKISDLSNGFWNLNQRFNQLVRSLRYLSLNLTKNQTYESYFFAQQIIRLVIVTLDQIDFIRFSNLRTLIINWGNEYHLKEIRSEILPNLIYLSLPISFDYQLKHQLTSEIFSNRFTSLRYVDLGKISMPIVISNWSQSPSIRSIRIISLNINIIPLILHSCSQLIHFEVRICGENNFDLLSLPIIFNHPLKQFSFIQPQISKFVFNLNNIFYLIPNLKRINLQLCTRSFSDLIEFLSNNFINLNHFDCHIIEYPNKDVNIDINHLRTIHRCYSSIQCTYREDCFCLYTTTKKIK